MAFLEFLFDLFGRFRSPLCPWTVAEKMNMPLPRFSFRIGRLVFRIGRRLH
jgi:hypothetical protein